MAQVSIVLKCLTVCAVCMQSDVVPAVSETCDCEPRNKMHILQFNLCQHCTLAPQISEGKGSIEGLRGLPPTSTADRA